MDFPETVFTHSSRLIKDYPGVDRGLQESKLHSIRQAIALLDGIILPRDKVFSFWYLLGRPSRRRGYADGLELRAGEQIVRPGGGLCQLTNMLHWAALNLDLPILERHRHSYDLFPDDQRSVPFGSGATVFYNYKDLRFRNSSGQPLQIQFRIEEGQVRLTVRSPAPLDYEIHIMEKEDRFYEKDGKRHRTNTLICERTEKKTGVKKQRKVLVNDCEVRYQES